VGRLIGVIPIGIAETATRMVWFLAQAEYSLRSSLVLTEDGGWLCSFEKSTILRFFDELKGASDSIIGSSR